MADNSSYSSVCLVGIMDHLWFHQVILFSENKVSFLCSPKRSITETPILLLAEEEPNASSNSCPTPITPSDEAGAIKEEVSKETERPTRAKSGFTPMERRVRRSYSSSPSAHTRPKKHSVERSQRLQKSMSCRSLEDLEMEEVKGFMDLGFIFKREHLSPRMVSLVPGIQRLPLFCKKQSPLFQQEEQEEEEEKQSKGNMRPYLSEAWLIRRPDSPLLNMRLPRASPASEMKRHLRFWARTVASVIEQEC